MTSLEAAQFSSKVISGGKFASKSVPFWDTTTLEAASYWNLSLPFDPRVAQIYGINVGDDKTTPQEILTQRISCPLHQNPAPKMALPYTPEIQHSHWPSGLVQTV